MTEPAPIKTRIAWHCDPQCGCQYFELLPEDRICIARMTKDERDADLIDIPANQDRLSQITLPNSSL